MGGVVVWWARKGFVGGDEGLVETDGSMVRRFGLGAIEHVWKREIHKHVKGKESEDIANHLLWLLHWNGWWRFGTRKFQVYHVMRQRHRSFVASTGDTQSLSCNDRGDRMYRPLKETAHGFSPPTCLYDHSPKDNLETSRFNSSQCVPSVHQSHPISHMQKPPAASDARYLFRWKTSWPTEPDRRQILGPNNLKANVVVWTLGSDTIFETAVSISSLERTPTSGMLKSIATHW